LYNQEVKTVQSYLASAKKGKTVANKVLYQNQLDFENYNLDCGREITLSGLLPKDDMPGPSNIIITENHLLLPIVGSSRILACADYYIVWDGELKIDDSNHASVDLIFIQSIPEILPPITRGSSSSAEMLSIDQRPAYERPRATREMKHPYIKYISFDLTDLQDAYKNSVTLNLMGLNFAMEYTYP
jgi:hypothetical protein